MRQAGNKDLELQRDPGAFLLTLNSNIPTSKKLQVQWALCLITEKGKCLSLSHVQLFATPCTVAHQAPLFVKFSRQEYWSVQPFP